ncbi:hypothetical protein DFH27DRAFT_525363 [Peziza echinospora]|nr:hypothetical protein DFH27DRAFT_525363 [Peziza echinospora]
MGIPSSLEAERDNVALAWHKTRRFENALGSTRAEPLTSYLHVTAHETMLLHETSHCRADPDYLQPPSSLCTSASPPPPLRTVTVSASNLEHIADTAPSASALPPAVPALAADTTQQFRHNRTKSRPPTSPSATAPASRCRLTADSCRTLYNVSTRATAAAAGVPDSAWEPLPYPAVIGIGHLLPRRTRLFVYVGVALAGIYLVDSNFNYSTLTRTLRTLRTALIITTDYKMNFKQNKSSEELSLLHSRNADRLVALCTENGGLYQKIGQAIAMQSALLPTEFREKFALFFSETPQASLAEIKQVLREEYPHLKDPIKELFEEGSFSQRALGSASIAQVHKAKLRGGTGGWVAVKIQKPGISRQSETDFRGEAANAEMIRELILEEFGKDGKVPGGAGGRVYVPKIYHEYSTRRIMVSEWIDGVLLSSRKAITDPHNPGARTNNLAAGTGRNYLPANTSGLGISSHEVMRCLLTLFSQMMFSWGHVHCDPHPGNILIRRVPGAGSTPQIVLLDHGLYIHLPPTLRKQYARLWTALMSLDTQTVSEITTEWGFGNAEMVASMTMLRPWRGDVGVDLAVGEDGQELTPYERQLRMKEAMSKALSDEGKVPQELVFLGRCMRILQANNQLLLSPVNRLKLLATAASLSLTPGGANYAYPFQDPLSVSNFASSISPRVSFFLQGYLRHVAFRITIFVLDLGFWFTRVRQWVFGGKGFEDELEERMKRIAKEEWGVEIGGGMFEG